MKCAERIGGLMQISRCFFIECKCRSFMSWNIVQVRRHVWSSSSLLRLHLLHNHIYLVYAM